MHPYTIGLMSGTSLDGADGLLADFSSGRIRAIAASSIAFPGDFRAELLALNTPGSNELHRAALAANRLAAVYAEVVHSLLAQASCQGIGQGQIQAIGTHGQTVRHQPRTPGDMHGTGYTIQLNNPALLAELTGIDVVADFRSRDVAAGGQGAPLVPAFHLGVFGRPDAAVAVLNLGGISNLSVLPPAGAPAGVTGHDCGPGNALMDAWCQQCTGQPFDEGGSWAASGQVVPALLADLLQDPYFAQPLPKSTGRDRFSLAWLEAKLQPFAAEQPRDIQATLTELTVQACCRDIVRYAPATRYLVVCGGGAFNVYLLRRLQDELGFLQVSTSDAQGLAPLQVEAAAFAWLARQMLQRLPGNLAAVTGAAGPRVLGALYPA